MFSNLKAEKKRSDKVSKTDLEELWIPKLIFRNNLPEVQVAFHLIKLFYGGNMLL